MSQEKRSVPYLKALELQGYKTFATKSLFEFAPAVTAIVGPNGSGKSNIADSIRWVLGEQSYSLLRGKKTEDMIFAGSDTRSRASMASVTITFDNSSGWLPIDFSEVSIGRRAYRDGTNEYWLNGQRVRLRDVSEILAQSGLARRTYTIIGQGLVDAALSLKAGERRVLFEEAAGISLYRNRREEALRRLETTRRNLDRVQDILIELRPRLKSLGRQAKRAQAYKQIERDLNEILHAWYGYHWYRLQKIVEEALESAEKVSRDREEIRRKQAASNSKLVEARQRIDTLRGQLQEWAQQVTAIYSERETKGRRLAVVKERLRWLGEQEKTMQSEVALLRGSHDEIGKKLSQSLESTDQAKQALAAAEVEIRQLQEAGEMGSEQMEDLRAQGQGIQLKLESLAGKRAAWSTSMIQLSERAQSLAAQSTEIKAKTEEARKRFNQAEEEVNKAHKADQELQQRLDNSIAESRNMQARQADLEEEVAKKIEEIAELQSEKSALEARIKALQESSEMKGEMAEHLMQAAEHGRLSGLLGRLSQHMKVGHDLLPAITAALGDFGSSLTFEEKGDLFKALDLLEQEQQHGRAALVPLSGFPELQKLAPLEDSGCVGNAADLIDAALPYRPIVEFLLGRTLVASDRKAAIRIVINLPSDGQVVTLAGDLYYPGGLVLVGQDRRGDAEDQKSQIEAKAELNTVQANLHDAKAYKAKLADELEEARARSSQVQSELEVVREHLQEARIRYSQVESEHKSARQELDRLLGQQQNIEASWKQTLEEIDRLEGRSAEFDNERAQLQSELDKSVHMVERSKVSLEMARIEAQLEVVRRDAGRERERAIELRSRVDAIDSDLKAKEIKLQDIHQEQASLQNELKTIEQEIGAIDNQLENLSDKKKPAETELHSCEEMRSTLVASESKLRSKVELAERQYSLAQIELAKRQEELSSLKRRIEDDFGLVHLEYPEGIARQDILPLEGVVQQLPQVENLPDQTEEHVNQLRTQLRRMGAVNPEAQAEFDEVCQRVDFMTSQINDLRQAEKQLQEVIAELDLLMEREFRKTFDAVAIAFKESFTRLFGGGTARLRLVEAENINDTGIDIEARLPGRREQGLAMLSGGERSLTACALIFSLLKVSPTPFCVLDEVDAMLDEANVIRFREMLRELSADTQFIIISHNRQTVQMADSIYGVSMGSDSASKVISLKMDEAAKEIEVEQIVEA